jgi:hypothetical protein
MFSSSVDISFFFFYPLWYLRDTARECVLQLGLLCVCNESYLIWLDVMSKFSARICPLVFAVLEAIACSRMPPLLLLACCGGAAVGGFATATRVAAVVATRAAGVVWWVVVA